jgi:hypothetical protein
MALLLIPIPSINGEFFPKYRHFFNMSRINLVTVKKGLSFQVSSVKRDRSGASINLPVQAFGPYGKQE